MDIFSLVSPENHPIPRGEYETHDSLVYSEEHSPSLNLSESPSPASSPNEQVLSSSPPRTPPRPLPRTPPRTPPRHTSHVDDRIRMRRYIKSCNTSPSSSSRVTTFSPSGDVHHHSNNEDVIITPSSSPTKSDTSLSPLQLRLNRAKSKRQELITTKLLTIDIKSQHRSHRAEERHESTISARVLKAKTDTYHKVTEAKERREMKVKDRQLNIELSMKVKEMSASRRKEDVIGGIIDKARKDELVQLAKERRDAMNSARSAQVEALLESKISEAHKRLKRNLYEKQCRACCNERKERAEERRKLIVYERRALLLAGLDDKLTRATKKSEKYKDEIATRAGEEIERSKEVARRVRAVRAIQRSVRDRYGFDGVKLSTPRLSQHDAARRLQRWMQWRVCVCMERFLASDGWDDDGIAEEKVGNGNTVDGKEYSKAIQSLEKLLKLFPVPPVHNGIQSAQRRASHQALPFDELRRLMMHPDTMKMANLVLDCLRPITEISFGTNTDTKPAVDGRTLLSLFLIAVHPRDVLGDEFLKKPGERLLANSALQLLMSFKYLFFSASPQINKAEISPSSTRWPHAKIQAPPPTNSLPPVNLQRTLLSSASLFQWWKNMDLEKLLEGMTTSLEQSWVVYLISSEALTYIADVTGVAADVSNAEPNRDDPLVSLKIRHSASRAGSRSHIKRIRLSLNKLIGSDEGKEFVKKAKEVALRQIAEANAIQEMKDEIDEMHHSGFNTPRVDSVPSSSESMASANSAADEQVEYSVASSGLPNELLSNVVLVHKILLTDSEDFNKLSWNGTNAQTPDITVDEFMSFFLPQSSDSDDGDVMDISLRIAQNMKQAFVHQVTQQMDQGNFDPIRALLQELHDKMRSLLPNRKDLHAHINDDEVEASSSVTDVMHIAMRSGHLLANYLESPARNPSSHELIQSLEAFGNSLDGAVPHRIQSAHLFAVASVAFLLHKTELCQLDISNYKLAQCAPLLHHVGHEYERKHFQMTYGELSGVSTEALQAMLPSTWKWMQDARSLFDSEQLTPQSSLEQKMDFVKGRGFVDGILFTKSQLSLPEMFALDVESINRIRNEARCCVIASALVLHACNISKTGSSILSSSFIPDELQSARDVLSSALRKRHLEQEALEKDVNDAAETLTKALLERDLTSGERSILKNHVTAILQGSDPVLKLLDNRVQSFFRFACKWKPNSSSSTMHMKTGRSVLNGEETGIRNHGIPSTKKAFTLAAKKESSRLGFAFVCSELSEAGSDARAVISLACDNFGDDIFYSCLSLPI